MEKTIEVRIKHKIDTHENWTERNPVLLNGELVFVSTDSGVKQKIGNGTTAYNDLPFTEDLLQSFLASKYVTKEELQEAITAVRGFANTESDM